MLLLKIDGSLVVHGEQPICIEVTVKRGAIVDHHVVVVNPDEAALIVGVDVDRIDQLHVLIDEDPGDAAARQADSTVVQGQLVDEIVPLTQHQSRIVAHRQVLELIGAATREGHGAVFYRHGAISRAGGRLRSRQTSLGPIGTGGEKSVVAIQGKAANITASNRADLVTACTIIATGTIVLIGLDGTEVEWQTAGAIDLGIVKLDELVAADLVAGIVVVAMVPLHHSRENCADVDGSECTRLTTKKGQTP